MKNSYRLINVFLACFLACLVQEALAQDRPCSDGSDCLPNECCLSPVVPRGNREAPGYCKPAGDTGNFCYLKNELSQSLPSTRLYFGACPCKAGLECEETGLVLMTLGPQGICVEPKEEKVSLPCFNQSNCGVNYCCVGLVQTVERRTQGSGECRKLTRYGGSCLVGDIMHEDHDLFFECPCRDSLVCNGTGVYDTRPGELGVCVNRKVH